MVDGVEYRTTKRLGGKPVYVQAGSLGALPNATTMAYKLSVANATIETLLRFDMDIYDATEGRRYMHPFITSDGAVRTAVYMASSARTITIKTFSNLSSYTAKYYAEYTKA